MCYTVTTSHAHDMVLYDIQKYKQDIYLIAMNESILGFHATPALN